MTKKSLTEVVRILFEELSPLESDERKRAVQAVMTLLGEETIKPEQESTEVPGSDEMASLSARARSWMRQNNLSTEQLQQTFLIQDGAFEIIATIPGKNNKEKVRNAYILSGLSHFMATGEQRFDDAGARALCERHGFYDSTNHAKYLKDGNEFAATASRERAWTLTPSGLRAAANLIKEICNQ